MKIVILNEQETLLSTLDKMLQHNGFNVKVFSNTISALEHIKSDLPDLVITDLLISYQTGLEFINNVRNIEEKYIYLFLATKVESEITLSKAEELGVNQIIDIPIELKNLLEDISTLKAQIVE